LVNSSKLLNEVSTIWKCFGKYSKEKDVCSNHGKCIDSDQCQCDPGYIGNECQKLECFEGNAIKCSGNGNCTNKPNVCDCVYGFVGEYCSTVICYNETVNTCSGNGNCTAPNVCECLRGFEGFKCEIKLQFSIHQPSSSASKILSMEPFIILLTLIFIFFSNDFSEEVFERNEELF
jgi:hypothetical protein